MNDPSIVFEDIVDNVSIQKRAKAVSKYYDDLILESQLYQLHGEGIWYKQNEETGELETSKENKTGWKQITLRGLKKKLYLCIQSVNALEAIRFYVSFACSFAFAERKLMEGNAKIIKFIARDEALHLVGTQWMINLMNSGKDDPEMKEIAEECKQESIQLFLDVVEQEKDWAKYLFQDGSMIGLNYDILVGYLEFITNERMDAIGLGKPFPNRTSNPLPWMNNWLYSDNVQVAPQEVEVSSYLVGQINAKVEAEDFEGFDI